jgi:hypothetical protein
MLASAGGSMRRFSTSVRWIFLAVWGVVLAPLIAGFVGHQAETRGWYDNPDEAGGWILSGVLSIARLPYFSSAAWLLSSITLGVWIDWFLRRLDGTRARKRISVGYTFLQCADNVVDRIEYSPRPWPENINDTVPDLMAAILTGKTIGIWGPDYNMFQKETAAAILVAYFQVVGTFLKEGHFKEAREFALVTKKELKRMSRKS